MSTIIPFVIGYFLGGMTALTLLALTVAARNGDRPQERPEHMSVSQKARGRPWYRRS